MYKGVRMNNTGDVVLVPKTLENQAAYQSGDYKYLVYVYDTTKFFVLVCDSYGFGDNYIEFYRDLEGDDYEMIASFNLATHTYWLMHKDLVEVKQEYDYFLEQAGEHRKHQLMKDRINEVFNPGSTQDDSEGPNF
jgi:hypothetical protein